MKLTGFMVKHANETFSSLNVPDFSREILIGRSKECDVPLGDLSVSRIHLRIFNLGDKVYIENKSSSGTKLNGQELVNPMPLVDEDVIEIGDLFLVAKVTSGEDLATQAIRRID
jgi:pSer/pThr/pTyr-binding forkhead associated (FHA) protein